MKILLVMLDLFGPPLVVPGAQAEIGSPDHEHEEDRKKQIK